MSGEHDRRSTSDDELRAEEEQRLLYGVEKDDDNLVSSERLLAQTWSAKLLKARKETILLVVLAALTFGSLLFTVPSWLQAATPASEPDPSQYGPPFESMPKDPYILDPNWDFLAKPQRRVYSWTISDVELNPDGVFRPMIVINGQFPGPLIECNEGDTIVVHVDNQAKNATSIHWHGIYQNGSNWMDGTVGITQCPIAPGAKFTYEFTITGQSGTYFYHGHHGAQAADGLLGPLIIHSKDERALQKLHYDTDLVIMVQDHYYDLSGALLMHYLEPDRENAEPVPDTALINGKNFRNCAGMSTRKCDSSNASHHALFLEPKKSHRLRIINVGAFAEFQIEIDEHPLGVTEVDGTDVVPTYYHRLNINPAQRYSVIVTANRLTDESFWFRARMITHCFAEPNKQMQPEVRAVVRYSSAPQKLHFLPTTTDWGAAIEVKCKDMNTTELKPAREIAAPPSPDATVYLRSNFEIGAWRLSRGFFNGSSWRANSSSPSLHRFTSGIAADNSTFTSSLQSPFGVNSDAFHIERELVYQTSGIRTIDVVISNFDDGNHPMHLHGYKFFVLAAGHGYPPENLYETLDLSNPLRRDTASVEAFGWVLLRFVADNPGMWAFHCHVTWHTEAGLLMQFLTRADEVAKWTPPEANAELCKLEGITRGDGPKDEIWYGNFGG